MTYRAAMAVLLMIAIAMAHPVAGEPIEIDAKAFSSTSYLSEQEHAEVRKTGILKGVGEGAYRFRVPQTNWYELWVEAAPWPTDLFLDGEFLMHTPFASGVWPAQGKAEKVMNLYLSAGEHSLTFSRPWHPGLPYLRKFVLRPAQDISGKVRLRPRKDSLAFRKDEPFLVRVIAERQPEPYHLRIGIIDVEQERTVRTIEQQVAPGRGLFEQELAIPTDREGVFDVQVRDDAGHAVDRTIQFLVVDTRTVPPSAPALVKDLVMKIDAAVQAPDYSSAETQVVKASVGAYRESGTKGYYEHRQDPDFFAYTLKLPAIQEPYLVEVDYPDDAQRTFTISVMENDISPYPVDSGLTSGGPYTLSHQTQTHQLFFYPRQANPRLLFLNWRSGQRAVVSQIRVYRLTSGLPALPPSTAERQFGMYFEEPLRFPAYFGALPVGNSWPNLLRSAERWAHWSRFIGANLWLQTIAVYQAMMWPGQTIPGYGMADEDGVGVIGPVTLKEPFKKDLVRLLLLLAEKYGLDFVGELHMPGNGILLRTLDRHFGGSGKLSDNGPHKPWLLVSKDGTVGVQKPLLPYFNPIYPGVQDWVASVVREIAQRYKDSPAFKGVALRLMGWTFSSWQAFPSINWGYEDYTVERFQRETGIHVPISGTDATRFSKRFEWLMRHAYEEWVTWRSANIRHFYDRLASILSEARPDLKLYINAFGPHYASSDWTGQRQAEVTARDEKGWLKLIRETGVDPALYRDDPRIIFSDARSYPAGIRGRGPDAPYLAAAQRDHSLDPQPIMASAKPMDGGMIGAGRFVNEYMEADFDPALIGLEPTSPRLRKRIRLCGVLNPAGRHALARYANAMADGNLTFVSDGGLGYILGQPEYLREFMIEYRSLPAIGMTRYGPADDPVALWFGRHQGRLYFYLVNRAEYPIAVALRFPGRPLLKRLSSAKPIALPEDGILHLGLQPYQLLAFVSESDASEPRGLTVQVPEEIKTQLQSQLDFAAGLLERQDSSALPTAAAFSGADRQLAIRALNQARQDYQAGRYWSARQALMGHHLVKLFHALDTYPPGLFHSKALEVPQGAMVAEDLVERVSAESHPVAQIVPASTAAARLAGQQMLVWQGGVVSFNLQVPFANRYRLAFAHIAAPPHARPRFFIDGAPVKEQDTLSQDTIPWSRKTVVTPLSLSAGQHTLSMQPADQQSSVGLLYVDLAPLDRDLVARDWRIIGPFKIDVRGLAASAGWEQVPPFETVRNMATAYQGDHGQRIEWIQPDTDEDYVNLFELTGAFSDSICYAVTTIDNRAARPAQLRFGVDYWARIWLNRQQIFEVTEGHGAPQKGAFAVPVELKAGPNELVVQVQAGSGGNGFWLAMSDPGDLVVLRTP